MSMSTARKSLRRLWKDAQVVSCADGTLKIIPVWKGMTPGCGMGVLTRMSSARMVADCLNIKGKK